MTKSIDDLRHHGIILITLGGWLTVMALGIMSLKLGEIALVSAGISAALNLIPSYCVLREITTTQARLAVGIMAACQPSLMLFAMQGTLWQIDMHLYFLVALAALTTLCDIRAIVLACFIIAFHHVVLSFAKPDWVFWGGGGIVRVSIHAIAVVLIGLILCWIGEHLRKVITLFAAERQASTRQAENLWATQSALEEALATIASEREANPRKTAEIFKMRKSEYASVAAAFEDSVKLVSHSVASTAQLLESSAKDLKNIAEQAGNEAREVVVSAEHANRAAITVARGVAELSNSIANIAVSVGRQSNLTARATQRSGEGGKTVGLLTQQSKTIGETTRAIVRIAERTNLLSLNAAIEAATSGPAGRGFTIVAHEVKSLAMQAGQAATEIDTFLNGVRSGTFDAERSFKAIETVVGDLDKAANTIRCAVENQRLSADTIEDYARNAAGEVGEMVDRAKALEDRARAAKKLSNELDRAAAALA